MKTFSTAKILLLASMAISYLAIFIGGITVGRNAVHTASIGGPEVSWKAADEKIGEIYSWGIEEGALQTFRDRTKQAIKTLEELDRAAPIRGLKLSAATLQDIPFKQATSVRILSQSVEFAWAYGDAMTERCVTVTFSLPGWMIVEVTGLRSK